MSDQFLGEIRIFPFDFAPIGWAMCNGQILPISQYAALFSLLGTNYGGNGTSSFGLPNFQGAVPINQGTGPGLSTYAVGEIGGTSTVTLLQPEMAVHRHLVTADAELATTGTPASAIYMQGHWPGTPGGQVALYNTLAPDTALNSNAISYVGGNQPHNNMMPYLALNFCIAMSGIFPPRS
jgi:microcystin-dependent protein